MWNVLSTWLGEKGEGKSNRVGERVVQEGCTGKQRVKDGRTQHAGQLATGGGRKKRRKQKRRVSLGEII
jgi:hypothetical protein